MTTSDKIIIGASLGIVACSAILIHSAEQIRKSNIDLAIELEQLSALSNMITDEISTMNYLLDQGNSMLSKVVDSNITKDVQHG